MRRAAHAVLGAVLLSLLVSLTVAPSGAVGATAPSRTKVEGRAKWAPSTGVTFNDPTVPRRRRAIIGKVIHSINETAKGEAVRLLVWNFDDRPSAGALLAARKRGVTVQVVVSGMVDNANWTRLRNGLNRNKKDNSWARKCRGGCRTNAKIMHTKVFLFSRVHRAKHTSMFGSSNLTTPAGNRQWNDMVTTRHLGLYRYFYKVFRQSARDRATGKGYRVHKAGRYRVTLFPARHRNPVVNELKRIRCHGATGGAGNGNGRTKIRIAIAGWFDAYGGAIAEKLRGLWDHGCDIKIVTTEAGRGVNQIMKDGHGRGPVPMRELSPDRNGDGIPERYLHMKSLAVSGVYAGDSSAHVVFTGSPNWSTRAQRSEEIWVRIMNTRGLNRRYNAHVDQLFRSRDSSARLTSEAQFQRWFGADTMGVGAMGLGSTPAPPSWFELD